MEVSAAREGSQQHGEVGYKQHEGFSTARKGGGFSSTKGSQL